MPTKREVRRITQKKSYEKSKKQAIVSSATTLCSTIEPLAPPSTGVVTTIINRSEIKQNSTVQCNEQLTPHSTDLILSPIKFIKKPDQLNRTSGRKCKSISLNDFVLESHSK